MANEMLSLAEVSRRSGLSRQAVYRSLDSGSLRYTDVDGRRLVSTDDYDEWVVGARKRQHKHRRMTTEEVMDRCDRFVTAARRYVAGAKQDPCVTVVEGLSGDVLIRIEQRCERIERGIDLLLLTFGAKKEDK